MNLHFSVIIQWGEKIELKVLIATKIKFGETK